ncbi:MAG: NAD(P)-dependent glycerol-3-phosphate dehydrogenase [Lentisphaeraceae bacterium]|nr:NAD(P)-dependent glycerol-3-phosphate dehydrogenase [Lentisphaeraceae bacterium]
MKACVISNGSFGTCLASILCENGHDVFLWGREAEYVEEMKKTRKNSRYLKGFALPSNLKLSSDMKEAVEGAELIVLATPTQFMRGSLEKLSKLKLNNPLLVNVAKGIEVSSLKRISEIVEEFFPGNHRYVALAGPSHAEEVMDKVPTALVAASKDKNSAKKVQKAFMNDYVRVYTSSDVTGVELGGALKNIFAISAGVIDGMGLGDNTKAALMTRGIVEMARLGKALGGKTITFNGLSGIGDLIVTCTSQHSRNRFVGAELGKGRNMSDIQRDMGYSVAEGVKTTESAWNLARSLKVSTPIIDEAYAILYKNADPGKAVMRLMTRDAKEEQN